MAAIICTPQKYKYLPGLRPASAGSRLAFSYSLTFAGCISTFSHFPRPRNYSFIFSEFDSVRACPGSLSACL